MMRVTRRHLMTVHKVGVLLWVGAFILAASIELGWLGLWALIPALFMLAFGAPMTFFGDKSK